MFEQIERYVLGRMDVNERIAFEARLESDSSLRNEVRVQQGLVAAVQARSFADEYRKHSIPTTKSNVFIMRRYRLIAASIIILIIAGSVWWMSGADTNSQLYTKYFTVDPGLPTTMALTDNYEFERGMVDYKQENYEQALIRWRHLQATSANNDTLSYFIGMAYLNKSDLNNAQAELQKVYANKSSAFAETATWYLALVHLKAGRKSISIELLKEIPNYEGSKAMLIDLEEAD